MYTNIKNCKNNQIQTINPPPYEAPEDLSKNEKNHKKWHLCYFQLNLHDCQGLIFYQKTCSKMASKQFHEIMWKWIFKSTYCLIN